MVRMEEKKSFEARRESGREDPDEFRGFGKAREEAEEAWEQWLDFVQQVLDPEYEAPELVEDEDE